MSPTDPESHEDSRLQELFDRTAKKPSAIEEARLLSRAAELPSRARRKPWADPRFLWPGALAAAAAALFLVASPGQDPERVTAKLATPSVAVASETSPAPAAPEIAPDPDEEEWTEDDELAASDVEDSDDLALAVLGENTDAFDLEPFLSED